MIIVYDVSTSDADIEDGYPEWSESCTNKNDLSEIAKRAEKYGIPPHRLTVMECWEDEEMGAQWNVLGSLEEILNQNK